jgi:hypothetical protein
LWLLHGYTISGWQSAALMEKLNVLNTKPLLATTDFHLALQKEVTDLQFEAMVSVSNF